MPGRVPASEYDRMRAPMMGGAFPFPVKYGYAMVGRVEAGPAELRGRTVFSLHPHQSMFNRAGGRGRRPFPTTCRRSARCWPPIWRPRSTRSGTARLVRPIASPSSAAAWSGLLVAYLCARLPGAEVTVVDIAPARAELAQRDRGRVCARPASAPADCDLVFHASASPAGLATALRLAGEEASVVELSWYGSGDVAAPLGEAFHSRRLRLISSQVGKVAPSHRPRWSHGRRLAAALALLADPVLDVLACAGQSPFRGFAGTAARGIQHGQRRGLPADPTIGVKPTSKGIPVYAVEVSDQIMIAHSFRGEVFGPAQKVHGATFVIRVAFLADTLDRHGIVVDIARAHEVLKEALVPLNYHNLDELPQFKGTNTTTEFLTRHLFDHLAEAARAGKLGRDGRELDAIRVTVAESPVARAWYEAPLW